MKKFLLFAWLLVVCGRSGAEEFKVDEVIHPVVAQLLPPQMFQGFSDGQMAISTASKEAAEHVKQGLTLINTAWEFEAYRHFCEAAKKDPDCLMAYWGISVSLAGGRHEFIAQRKASINRMLDLLEADEKAENSRFTELEKRYAQAAGFMFTSGVRIAGKAFAAAAEKFPADIQSRLFGFYFLRDGFDEGGKPLVGQRKVDAGLAKLLQEHPDNYSVKAYWVSSQAEAPLNATRLRSDVLPVIRDMTKQQEGFPPFYLMLSHVEARCGNAALAIQAALKGVELYEAYMKDQKVTVYDCEGWVRAKIYLASLYAMKGELVPAEKVASELAGMKVEEDRVSSRGAGLLLWEGRTVGGRIFMGQDDAASFDKGLKIIKTLPDEEWFKEKSLSIAYRECLSVYLEARKALSTKDLAGAKKAYDQLVGHVGAMVKSRELASKNSSYGSWGRAASALTMLIPELRGLISQQEEGAVRLAAATWFRSASDRQPRPSNLLPPPVDYPMEWRLGNFYLSEGKFERAEKAFVEGLALRPNHLATLEGYHEVLKKLKKTEAAKVLEERIKAVKK